MSTDNPFLAAVVQAAPVFLDREATVQKTLALIEEAAQRGAKLIAFPECWIPGYPWWVWLGAPKWGMQFVEKYNRNAMSATGPEAARIAAAARAHNINIVLGYTEKAGGSLYIAQLLIDDQGKVMAARRKLRATHVERTVFGEGDGSDLRVHDTPLGRLGALCCWEHLSPLTKYAMFSQNEQIHIAAWPSFSVYEGSGNAMVGPEVNNAVNRIYAVEGQCFVLASSQVISPEMRDLLCDTDQKRQLLNVGGGIARIFGPDGRSLAEPLAPDEEGILYAQIDLGQIALAKALADPIGHYSRPDVVRLLFNPEPQRRVEYFSGGLDEAGSSVVKFSSRA